MICSWVRFGYINCDIVKLSIYIIEAEEKKGSGDILPPWVIHSSMIYWNNQGNTSHLHLYL